MNPRRFLWASLAGGVVLFLLGGLFYGLLLSSFMEAHSAGGVVKDPPDFGPLVIGELLFGVFLTLIISKWPVARGFSAGARAGALIGFLLGLSFNLSFYATMNVSDVVAIPVDTLVTIVRTCLAGGVIAAVLGRS